MKYIIFLILFHANNLQSQAITILDAESSEPIPFVTVILKKGNQNVHAAYTDEHGVVDVSGKTDFDTAEISCLGFKSQLVKKEKVTGIFYLESETLILDELKITGRKSVVIGGLNEKRKKYLPLSGQYIASCLRIVLRGNLLCVPFYLR